VVAPRINRAAHRIVAQSRATRHHHRAGRHVIRKSPTALGPAFSRLRKRHWEGYHHVIKSGESRYGHGDILAVPGIKEDGAGISIEFTIVPLRDGAGELTGLAAIMRDVTKRFEEMRALKQKLAETTKP
jgi:hypothetical protein